MSLSDKFEAELILHPTSEIINVVKSVLKGCGVHHICYFSPSNKDSGPDIATNYPNEWVNHYTDNAYHLIDPVLTQIWRGHRPLNWDEVSQQNQDVRNFFGESQEFGLSKSGMTFPIRDTDNRSAYFSISSDMSSAQWVKA